MQQIMAYIRGVQFPEMGDEFTHCQFTDDTKIITVAKGEFIHNTFSLFWNFGNAFKLFVNKTRVKVVLVFADPVPQELADLPFSWGMEDNPSKVLSVFMGEEISPKSMSMYL